ncbi:hypothetical protein M0657_012111 [Pyricularia oryzae]|nr:hypothetical protein M0657_012111 [Pyricularia oryzae]
MFATEKTHLLGNHRPRDARWNYRWIPYALLLLMCVGCNPILFLLHVENNLLAAISFPLDLLQERLWGFMKPILNAVTDEALRRTNDRSVRRLIRKSDSLATIGKTMLKVESAFITLVKVLSQAGFPLYLAAFSSIALTGALALGTFCLFGPISEDAQRLKSSRDDSVEGLAPKAMEDGWLYTESLQRLERTVTLWKLFICLVVVLAWYFLGAKRADIAIFARLAHQISSADDNFQKMSQTYQKSARIIQEMSMQGGVFICFASTCANFATRRRLRGPDIEAHIVCSSELPNIGNIDPFYTQLLNLLARASDEI